MIHNEEIINFFRKDELYAIFTHQAVLSSLFLTEFEKEETISIQRIINGFRNGTWESILEGERRLPITDDLFDKDALYILLNDLFHPSFAQILLISDLNVPFLVF